MNKTVKIPNITCGHCVANIKRELVDLEGVVSVGGDPDSKEVTVEWAEPAKWEDIEEVLNEIGYPPA